MKLNLFLTLFMNSWPDYMRIWLHTVTCNPNITFTLITNLNTSDGSWHDSFGNFRPPPNLHLVETDIESVIELARSELKFDFRLKITTPYKLCDLRPVMGLLYNNLLNGYTHWGWANFDLIMGDILDVVERDYDSEDIVYYTKGLYLNCVTILKNSQDMIEAYKAAPTKLLRKVFHQTPDHPIAFDEDLLSCQMQRQLNFTARYYPNSDCSEGQARRLWFYFRGRLFYPNNKCILFHFGGGSRKDSQNKKQAVSTALAPYFRKGYNCNNSIGFGRWHGSTIPAVAQSSMVWFWFVAGDSGTLHLLDVYPANATLPIEMIGTKFSKAFEKMFGVAASNRVLHGSIEVQKNSFFKRNNAHLSKHCVI